jgi:probable phosphoglycerate mutase
MEGTRIVLVRHGESIAQQQQFVAGHRGCQGLSERGRAQAALLRDRLVRTGELADAVALYASVMPRAIETAEIIAKGVGDGGIELVTDCAFCEHHPGEGDGLPWHEYEARWPAPEEWDPDLRRDPGGETWNEMAARVASGLDAIIERHAGELVVVACHGGVVVQSMFRWLGMRPGTGDRAWINPQNTSLTEWRFAVNPFSKGTLPLELVRFNDWAHLAGSDLVGA